MSAATLPTSAAAPGSHWWQSRTVRRFARHKLAVVGVVMIGILIFACVVGPHLLPYDELYIDLRARFAPPLTGYHIFGTDPLGRDIAARLSMPGASRCSSASSPWCSRR